MANLTNSRYTLVNEVVQEVKLQPIKDGRGDFEQDWDLFWTDTQIQSIFLCKMKNYQKINHFPGIYTLARKNHLALNLTKI